MGEKLGHYMWQNFVLVSGSIKSIAKGIHETFLFSGKIIFYCIGSIAICTKKVSCIFSQPLYQLAQILPLIHTFLSLGMLLARTLIYMAPFPLRALLGLTGFHFFLLFSLAKSAGVATVLRGRPFLGLKSLCSDLRCLRRSSLTMS